MGLADCGGQVIRGNSVVMLEVCVGALAWWAVSVRRYALIFYCRLWSGLAVGIGIEDEAHKERRVRDPLYEAVLGRPTGRLLG